jgi:hypothetical protein
VGPPPLHPAAPPADPRPSPPGSPPSPRATGSAATCRNCGAEAPGTYCPACGQETALALPTAGKFLREAAGRYVALDGRFARTLFHLLFRPGFLTNEYFAGRRKRYIRPARLFLVLALALFAILRVVAETSPGGALIIVDKDDVTLNAGPPKAPVAGAATAAAEGDAATASPGAKAAAPGATSTAGTSVKAVPPKPAPSTPPGNAADAELARVLLGAGQGLRIDRELGVTVVGPEGPLRDQLQQRMDRFNRLGKQDKIDQVIGGALRYGPYALIALLPWFALLLQIVYAGRRRQYPHRPRRFAEHLVYGAHNHAFACLALIVAVAAPWPPLRAAAILWMFCYFLWSMKVVYGGRWIGVLARGVVVAIAYLVMFALVTSFLLVTAIMVR